MAKMLLIRDDPPYGTEPSYNGIRLALGPVKAPDVELRVLLLADAVGCARVGQRCPDGYCNLERMLRSIVAKGAGVGACGSCLDARGIAEADPIEGVDHSSMAELTEWTLQADKVLSF